MVGGAGDLSASTSVTATRPALALGENHFWLSLADTGESKCNRPGERMRVNAATQLPVVTLVDDA